MCKYKSVKEYCAAYPACTKILDPLKKKWEVDTKCATASAGYDCHVQECIFDSVKVDTQRQPTHFCSSCGDKNFAIPPRRPHMVFTPPGLLLQPPSFSPFPTPTPPMLTLPTPALPLPHQAPPASTCQLLQGPPGPFYMLQGQPVGLPLYWGYK